jgi:hypothetical protein
MAGLILAGIVLLLGSPSVALADACTDLPPAGLNGTVVGAECQVNSAVTAQGTYNFAAGQTLHICSPAGTCATATLGTITVPPLAGGNNLTLNMSGVSGVSGGLIMDDGAAIVGDVNTASGIGANITITTSDNVFLAGSGASGARITSNQGAGSCSGGHSGNITITAGGNIDTQAGSVISAGDLSLAKGNGFGPHCPGGEIRLTAGSGKIDVDGKVLSQSSMSGTGAKQPPGGGPITITAGCDLTVSDTGVVSSRGHDPGADLVSLTGGCSVLIDGLVESTGPGHAVPNSPANHCATGVYAGIKPANSTACIQIVSGGGVIIDSNLPHNGEINADTAQSGGHQIAWIDIFANFNIGIGGDTSGGPYAVHANEFVTNSDGGLITIKGKGQVSVQGLAVQANSTAGGGHGGSVDIEANDALGFGPGSSVQAKGATSGGGHQGGGTILGRSWASAVAGTNTSDLNASGGPPAAPTGSVSLFGCTGVFYNGTSEPAFVPGGGCGVVIFPPYLTFPSCACALPCIPC